MGTIELLVRTHFTVVAVEPGSQLRNVIGYGSGFMMSYKGYRFFVTAAHVTEPTWSTKAKEIDIRGNDVAIVTHIAQEYKGVKEKLLDYIVNATGEIAWSGAGFRIKFFNDVLRELINRYAYVWFTGGRAGAGHADFFSLYKGGKLYFIPMTVILQEVSVDLPSTLILRGISANEYILPEEELKVLNRLKIKGNNINTQLNKMESDSIKGINKPGRVELGNYRRLGL